VSAEQLAAIETVYRGWTSGDLDRALACLAPDVEWTAIESAPDAGIYRGHEGARAYMQDWLDDFELMPFEILEVVEAGDRLVLVTRGRARGRASGLETEIEYAQVYSFEHGLLHRIHEYAAREEALAAVGLT
jgi:ketosteroid isomerase-like protein